eukprot:1761559-Pyramimonas_sp.AAC.1
MRRLARTRRGAGIGQIFLCVNMAVVLAFARSRSRGFKLPFQIRRFNACALALGIAPYFRWIPSGFNQSDAGGRDHSEVSPKLLTDFLDQQPLHGVSATASPFRSRFGSGDVSARRNQHP